MEECGVNMSGLNAKNAPARKDRERLPHFSPNVERVRQPLRARAPDGGESSGQNVAETARTGGKAVRGNKPRSKHARKIAARGEIATKKKRQG